MPVSKQSPNLMTVSENKKTPRFIWIFVIILVLVNLGWSAYLYWKNSESMANFNQYFPQDSLISQTIINKQELFNQLLPLTESISNNCPNCLVPASFINKYLAAYDLDYRTSLEPLFKQNISLATFQADSESQLPFVLILEKKAASAQINKLVELLKTQLKKDFDISEKLYRQNNVFRLNYVYQPVNLYYSQVKDFFVIANSQKQLEKSIDLIIDNL